jgi:hypothetical protein
MLNELTTSMTTFVGNYVDVGTAHFLAKGMDGLPERAVYLV